MKDNDINRDKFIGSADALQPVSSDHAEGVAPAKCSRCERPMSTPVVCDFCHTLEPGAVGTDYFSLMSLPRRFDLSAEEIRQRFLALNRHTHPDFHAAEPAEVQSLSLKMSAAVNDAYRVLADPASRGDYLLELLGGPSSAADKSVPEGFLGTMMMMQEEIADAAAGGHAEELARIGQVLRTQRDGLMRRIEGLFADYDQAVACNFTREDLLLEIRQQLNAVSYVRKLLLHTQ